MQKVTPKPYAPPKTDGAGKSIRLFSLRFHFISNRHALPETGTGVTLKPAYSVFDSILLNIVRNICPLVKRKTLPAEHFVQKNKNKTTAAGTPLSQKRKVCAFLQRTGTLRGGSFCLLSACRDAPLGQRQGGVFRLPPPYLWTPPTPQRAKGCTPLTILKKKSKHKKASAAPVGAIALTLFSLLHP